MAKKGNIRSIRFSDEIIEIIEAQEGDNFTTKFERLVRKCYQEKEYKEQELKLIQERIEDETQNWKFVQKEISRLRNTARSLNFTLDTITRQINQAMDQAENNLNLK